MTEKKNFIINCAYCAVIFAIIWLIGKYILPAAMPFLIAFIISYFLRKPINRFCRKEGVNKTAVSIIVLLLFYIFMASLIATISVSGYAFIQNIIKEIPNYYTTSIEPMIDDLYQYLVNLNENMSPEIKSTLYEILGMVFSELKGVMLSISNWLIKAVTSVITAAPGFFVSFILAIISSFFIVIDYDKIVGYLQNMLNPKMQMLVSEGHDYLKNKLLIVIWSYIKIIGLTFVELSVGLMILGVENAIVIAAIIAIFDILPVLGTGGIVIPWGIISLCYGDYVLGFGLLILYVLITVIRNIVEPKMVGAELGLHPLATLMAMIIGANLYGILGLFGLPILISFILYEKEIHKEY